MCVGVGVCSYRWTPGGERERKKERERENVLLREREREKEREGMPHYIESH